MDFCKCVTTGLVFAGLGICLAKEPAKHEHIEVRRPLSAIDQGRQLIVAQTTATTAAPGSVTVAGS
jgi:hypothetical protein